MVGIDRSYGRSRDQQLAYVITEGVLRTEVRLEYGDLMNCVYSLDVH